MDKSNHSSRDKEYYSCELPNLELQYFAAPPPKKFADLSKQELNQLVEERHYRPKKRQQTGPYQPFEVSNALQQFKREFSSDLTTIKFSTSFHCKPFLALKAI